MTMQTYNFGIGVLTIQKNSDSRLFRFVGDRTYQEIIWNSSADVVDGTPLSDIDKIFDMELFDDMIADVPSVSVFADECILSYQLAVGKKMRTICITLHKKIYKGESEAITTLRDELTVCRNKIAQLEQMANENTKKISMLERYVGRIIFSSKPMYETDPVDFINKCSLIDFSDAESIKYFYSLFNTINIWLEPHKKYTNIKEDMTTFINLAGKNINTIFQHHGHNIVSELINVMASDRIDVDTWKHITACLKKNGADLNKVGKNGEKFTITQLNKIAERKPMMVSHVLSELL